MLYTWTSWTHWRYRSEKIHSLPEPSPYFLFAVLSDSCMLRLESHICLHGIFYLCILRCYKHKIYYIIKAVTMLIFCTRLQYINNCFSLWLGGGCIIMHLWACFWSVYCYILPGLLSVQEVPWLYLSKGTPLKQVWKAASWFVASRIKSLSS